MNPPLSDLQKLARRRSRLLARIHRRWNTVIQTHAVGPLRLQFTRIADPDAVLDQICRDEDRREKNTGQRHDGDDLHLPYWAELWDSAIGMGQRIVGSWEWGVGSRKKHTPHPTPHPPPSVLDLGCGMGFAGMAAAAMGAQVLLADLETDALLFARLNTLPWSATARIRQVNWRTDRLDESFDLILGADVLYDRSQWESLDTFFRRHLRPGGTVLLGEPGRQTGDMFPDWITQRSWSLEFIEQKVPTRDRPIRIFQLKTR